MTTLANPPITGASRASKPGIASKANGVDHEAVDSGIKHDATGNGVTEDDSAKHEVVHGDDETGPAEITGRTRTGAFSKPSGNRARSDAAGSNSLPIPTAAADLPAGESTASGSGRSRSGAATGDKLPAPSKEAIDGTLNGETKEPEKAPDSTSVIAPATASGPLVTRPFTIKCHLLDTASAGAETTGSILSQTLDNASPGLLATKGADASVLSLTTVRKLIPAMSRFSRIHKFCTKSGVLVDDESIQLGAYLALEPDEVPAAESTAETDATKATNAPKPVRSLNVYYRPPASNPITPTASDTKAPGVSMTLTKPEEGLKAADAKAGELTSKSTMKAIAQSGTYTNAGLLTEAEWGKVLRNCAVFYGWIVDPQTKSIRRAPQAAFQLRSGDAIEKAIGSASTSTASAAPSTGDISEGITSVAAPTSAAAPQASVATSEPAAKVPATVSSKTSDADANAVSVQADAQMAAALNIMDHPSSQDTSTDPKNSTSTATNTTGEPLELPSERQARLAKIAAAKDAAQQQISPAAAAKVAERSLPVKNDNAIPNFRVNDDSKIDITICKHELAMSMAKNDFSSQSTEASVNGGAMGITVGVSAGYASSKSSGHSETETEATQTMVARYMYPRCDVFLTPTDLEPTPQFAALLETIHRTKNIRALRKLQTEYGQLFCQELTLGARLLTTQTMSTKYKGSTDEQKEQFKVSVGLSVQTPYGGASMKHEEEKGHSEETKKSETTSNEAQAFEAVGGDTILANNPEAWCATVSLPNTWRVINRQGLFSIVEMISQMPGYAAVQQWFVQAVPALSKYLTLDDSHTVTCRLKVLSPTNSLHVRNQDGKARHYLGYPRGSTVSPCLNTVNTTVVNGTCPDFWVRMEATVEKRLFEPQTYRAPVLFGFNDYDVAGAKYGAKYNESFSAVTWDIVAPFADVLAHGGRVILRTHPADDKDVPTHMVVFRNAQGEYLPGISDRDEYQYWRLLRHPPVPNGTPLKPGDEVRLAWSFKDQTTGFRDYFDDAFGRRQIRAPPEMNGQDILYLKVPWPRFENEGHGTNMILSPDASTTEIVADVNTAIGNPIGTFKYALQDLRFRMDTVENSGRGDADDYLLKDVNQQGDQVIGASLTIGLGGNVFQMNNAMFGFGIGGANVGPFGLLR